MIYDGFLETLRMLIPDPATSNAFIREFGGTDVLFPSTRDAPIFQAIARTVGDDGAARLTAHFRGLRVYVPRNAAEERATRDEQIRARIMAGESVHEVARSYRQVVTLTVRHVRRIAAGVPRMQARTTRKRELAEVE